MLKRVRERVRNYLLFLQTLDQERGGWVRRVGFPVGMIFIAGVIVFQVVTYTQVIPADLMPIFIIVYVVVQLVLGVIMIAAYLVAYGRAGWYCMTVAGIVGVLFIVVWLLWR
ncbi:MAG: hypothetical protein ACE5H4_01165 [Candidatus Thorarchaeota archaeon]